MSKQPENLGVPRPLVGRTKQKRRSSILKTTRPFEEIQNVACADERAQKDRRVSFCNTIVVNEFLKELPTQLGLTGNSGEPPVPYIPPFGEVKKVELPSEEDTFIQISTPKGKKRRRISSTKIEQRLSIIPKLDKSFVQKDEEDFEVYVDDIEGDAAATIAPREEITLKEVVPESMQGATLNDFCAVEVASSELPCGLERLESHKAVQPTFGIGANPTLSSLSRKKTANASGIPESHPPCHTPSKDTSDMELTLIESTPKETHMHESLFSPEKLLNAAKMHSLPCSQHGMVHNERVECKTGSCADALPLSSNDQSEMAMSFTMVDIKAQLATMNDSDMSLTCIEPQPNAVTAPNQVNLAPISGPNEDQMDLTDIGRALPEDGASLGVEASETTLDLSMLRALYPPSKMVCENRGSTHAESQYQLHPTSSSGGGKAPAANQLHLSKLFHSGDDTDMDMQLTTYQSCAMSMTCVEDTMSKDATEVLTSSEKKQQLGSPPSDEATNQLHPSTMHSQTGTDPNKQLQSCAMNTVVREGGSMEKQGKAELQKDSTDLNVTTNKPKVTSSQAAVFNTTNTTTVSATIVDQFKPPSFPPNSYKANQLHNRSVGKPLIVASSVMRTPQCTPSFLPTQRPGFPTPLGPSSALYTQLRNKPRPSHKVNHPLAVIHLPSHTVQGTMTNPEGCHQGSTSSAHDDSSHLMSKLESEPLVAQSDHLSDDKPVPSTTSDNSGPAKTELLHQDETTLPQGNTSSDNWLQATVDGSFSLICSSPESCHSPSTEDVTIQSNVQVPSSQVGKVLKEILPSPSLSVTQKPPSSTALLSGLHHHKAPLETSLLRNTIENLKANAEQKEDDSVLIQTPKVVPLEQNRELQDTETSMHLGIGTADVSHHPFHLSFSESALMQQSLAMSPSAFSKFLTALKCNKSMCGESLLMIPPPENITPETPPPSETVCYNTTPLQMEHNVSTSSSHTIGNLSAKNENHGSILKTEITPTQHDDKNETTIIEPHPDHEVAPSTQPCTKQLHDNSTSQLRGECRLFSDHLQELHSRLSAAVNRLQLRLKNTHYLSAHTMIEKGLQHWCTAAHAGLCGISTLITFGKLSGLSASYCWDSSGVPNPLPSPPSWNDDLAGDNRQKAKWLEELHTVMLQIHSVAENTLGEAAILYPWHLEKWGDTEVEICMQSKLRLRFELEPYEDYMDCNVTIRRVHLEPPEGHKVDIKQKEIIAHCKNTASIAQYLITSGVQIQRRKTWRSHCMYCHVNRRYFGVWPENLNLSNY